ncbi:retrovirus-related pol polyprotein from transposon TNT 1-94 [Tanacetum coccineum]
MSLLLYLDFQNSPDDEEDTRSNQEYLNDLEEEYQARALLAKSKRFFKKGTQRLSSAKATDQTKCHKYGKKGHFARDCWSKSSVPSYQSPFQPKLLNSSQHKLELSLPLSTNKLSFLSSSASASKGSMVKNKCLIAETYEWDEEEVERPWLSEAEGFILPNHDAGKILPGESQRNTTDPPVAVTNSSATDYDSTDESSVCSTPLPPLKKLDGAEPISRPKTIKSILRSKSIFKAETLKSVIINKPSSAPAKGNKSSPGSKVNSTHAGKLKSVKIEDDPPLSIVMKKLNDLKLQISKNQLSYSRNNQPQQCERTDHKTCDHAEYISTMNMSQHLKSLAHAKGNQRTSASKVNSAPAGKLKNVKIEDDPPLAICERTDHRTCDHAEFMSTINMTQHLKSLGGSSSRSMIQRQSKRFFPPYIHYRRIDHLSDDCLYYPICRVFGSYDHETNGHNMIISLEKEIKPRNLQYVIKRCETCGSTVHNTTDHYDIEWFKRGKAIQDKNVDALKLKKTISSKANRSKTPTKGWASKQN